jgi:ubiquinone/menaquinone biosynthesis C-methylase UbiE
MEQEKNVLNANIAVHTRMIDDYESEPHWRAENIAKVKNRLQDVLPHNRGKALDVGAGTGFLTRLLTPIFEEVTALDITEPMLAKIPKTSNLSIIIAQAEELPFENNSFDFVCAYSFLHHLFDPDKVLKEMVRVLKPGGTIYVDLEPNSAYWNKLKKIDESQIEVQSTIVKREINATIYIEKYVEEQYAIPQEVFAAAEYSKSVTGGFTREKLHNLLISLGITSVEVNLDWFMGQALVMHGKSFELASEIEKHLREILPASEDLFKYIWMTGEKK